LLPRHLCRIEPNMEQVFFEIDFDLFHAWKP
jgi:hypothetical protein